MFVLEVGDGNGLVRGQRELSGVNDRFCTFTGMAVTWVISFVTFRQPTPLRSVHVCECKFYLHKSN